MKQIKDVLKNKGQEIWSIAPDAPVYEAIKLMADKEIGALLVMQDGQVLGLISERDYIRKVALQDHSSKTTRVREIMTSPVVYVNAQEPVDKCMALMTLRRIRHLPVFEDEQLIGMISMRDLVRAVIVEQTSLIQQLERYILKQTGKARQSDS